MENTNFPVQIKGSWKDNFWDKNPDIEMFPWAKSIKRKLLKDKSSQLMWAIHHFVSPFSFFDERMDKAKDLRQFLSDNLFKSWWEHEMWEDYKYLENHYREDIVVDLDLILYSSSNQKLQENILSGKTTLVKIEQEQRIIDRMRKKAYEIMDETVQYWEIQGERQPGLGMRTKKKRRNAR